MVKLEGYRRVTYDDLARTDDVTVYGDLTVKGDTTIDGNSTIDGLNRIFATEINTDTLVATSNIEFYGDMVVYGDMTMTGSGITASNITADGTADSTTFLRGDGEWAVPAGGTGTSFSVSDINPGDLNADVINPNTQLNVACIPSLPTSKIDPQSQPFPVQLIPPNIPVNRLGTTSVPTTNSHQYYLRGDDTWAVPLQTAFYTRAVTYQATLTNDGGTPLFTAVPEILEFDTSIKTIPAWAIESDMQTITRTADAVNRWWQIDFNLSVHIHRTNLSTFLRDQYIVELVALDENGQQVAVLPGGHVRGTQLARANSGLGFDASSSVHLTSVFQVTNNYHSIRVLIKDTDQGASGDTDTTTGHDNPDPIIHILGNSMSLCIKEIY